MVYAGMITILTIKKIFLSKTLDSSNRYLIIVIG